MKSIRPGLLTLIIILSFLQVTFIPLLDGDRSIPENNIEITKSFEVEAQGLKYAIITTSNLQDDFHDLQVWRSMKGTKAEIFLIDGQSSILTGEDGRDDAERLFNAITRIYLGSNCSLEYVLLGGDSELIPTRYLHANASRWEYDDNYLSDVYYSSPGTDWDADGDGRFGERDDIEMIGIENLSFPVKVGRFPVSNGTETRRMVDRIIDYERSPPEGDWVKRGILSSSLMDRPNWPNDPLTPEDEGFDPYKDNGYKAYANYTRRYLPLSLDIIEAHDYMEYEGGRYNSSVDGLEDSTLSDLLNEGSSFMSFAGQSFYDIEYGHSPPIAYSLAHYRVGSGNVSGAAGFGLALTYEDTQNLTNGEKLPVVYISSCDSANFSSPGDTSLEGMVLAPNGGAISMIGSTGVSWRGEGVDHSLGNWYLLSQFWKKMMGDQRPGDALFEIKQEYIEQKWDEFATKEVMLIELYTYNFLGDPAMTSWMGDPADLSSSDADTIDHYAGGDIISTRVTNSIGSPVANVMVVARSNETGEVFIGYSGPDGWANVETRFTSGGNVSLLAWSKNYLPSIQYLSIMDAPLDIQVDIDSISIDPLPLTETKSATISFSVANIGGRDAPDASVGIYLSSLDGDPESWPEPESVVSRDIDKGSSEEFSFDINPLRSWNIISVGVISDQIELNLENNVGSVELEVNARPRFLPTGLLMMKEDKEGGSEFNLAEMVFDPDDDEEMLLFTLGTGSPSWCTIYGHRLNVEPPENWSGTFRVTLRVSDGMATDQKDIDIFVEPVNDDPVITGIASEYHIIVDSPFLLTYQAVDVEGDMISLELLTNLTRLRSLDGTLRMVPYPEDIGSHEVTLVFSDGNGGFSNHTFYLVITDNSNDLFFSQPSIHLNDARVGERFKQKILIQGDLIENATFSDDSDLFAIDPDTGWIEFEPVDEDIGEHWVKITVTSGNTTIQRTFRLEVKEKEESNRMIWYVLGVVSIILLIILAAVIFWKGPSVAQYGLEE